MFSTLAQYINAMSQLRVRNTVVRSQIFNIDVPLSNLISINSYEFGKKKFNSSFHTTFLNVQPRNPKYKKKKTVFNTTIITILLRSRTLSSWATMIINY